jgi:chromosomal replication initiation ATPase DnaA
MFVAQYRRTEASARPDLNRDDGWVTRSIHQIRAEKAEERRKAEYALHAEERERQQAMFAARMTETERRRQEYLSVVRFKHTHHEIERRACKLFRVTPAEIRANRRHRDIIFARQFIMYWTARLTPLSTPAIGRLIGGRDHTTILSGKRAYVHKRKFFHKRTLREAR